VTRAGALGRVEPQRLRSLIAGALVTLVSATGCSSAESPPRDIVLVARGMRYAIESEPGAHNPVIHLQAGERVRLILKNEAPGLLHDFEIPAWGVHIPPLRAGDIAEVIFTVPDTVGKQEYRCRPHAETMRGFVEISADR
jgi:hypothetical protein